MKHLNAPGILSFRRGMVKVSSIQLVVDHDDCKVWELKTTTSRADIRVHSIMESKFDGWRVELDMHDVIMEGKNTRLDSTQLDLALNRNKHWVVSARSLGRNDYVIYAYAY